MTSVVNQETDNSKEVLVSDDESETDGVENVDVIAEEVENANEEDDDDDSDDDIEADGLTDVGLYNVLGNFLVDEQGNTIGASLSSIALELKRMNGYIKRLVPEKTSSSK
jgi:hypothetical protein